MLYLSTCVGFGYGLCGSYFLEQPGGKENPIIPHHFRHPSLSRWPTNINVVPIDYAFRPRLRDRLTLRRLTLRRNPWTFGDTVFHSVCRYSCQHSHFRCLQEPSRVSLHQPTERSATVVGEQNTDDGRRITSRPAGQSLQLFGDYLIFVSPLEPKRFVDVTQIERVARPNPHLIGRTDRHPDKASKFRFDCF